MQGSYEAAVQAAQRFYDVEAAWMRHILLIASSSLTLLVILNQDIPDRDWPRYFLAAAWFLLATGILAGGVASYSTVSTSRNLALQQGLDLVEAIDTGRSPLPKPVLPAGLYKVFATIMVFALIGAVTCLTGYGMTRLLSDLPVATAP